MSYSVNYSDYLDNFCSGILIQNNNVNLKFLRSLILQFLQLMTLRYIYIKHNMFAFEIISHNLYDEISHRRKTVVCMNCTCRERVNYNVSMIWYMTLIVEMIYPVPYLSVRCIDLVYGLI